jgi:hypothetical protein
MVNLALNPSNSFDSRQLPIVDFIGGPSRTQTCNPLILSPDSDQTEPSQATPNRKNQVQGIAGDGANPRLNLRINDSRDPAAGHPSLD